MMTRSTLLRAAGAAALAATAAYGVWGPGAAASAPRTPHAPLLAQADIGQPRPLLQWIKQAAAPVLPKAMRPAPQLKNDLQTVWSAFPGRTGISVRRIDGDWALSPGGQTLYPQQSVSKIWVAMTILEQVDQGRLTLNSPVRIGMEDLTLFHQPIRAKVLANGGVYTDTVGSLLEQSITKSDCTANDSLLRTAGGPRAVRDFIRRHQLGAIRFSDGERLMQSRAAGLQWQQSFSLGNAFEIARAKVPMAQRWAALRAYIANPEDGAAPEAITGALAKLARGELLSPASTSLMMGIMGRTVTGPNRLRAGLPLGWGLMHKTGTGQILGGVQAGYNDIGIVTAPDGARYAVAVMMGETSAPIPARMEMMQAVTRAVATWHNQ